MKLDRRKKDLSLGGKGHRGVGKEGEKEVNPSKGIEGARRNAGYGTELEKAETRTTAASWKERQGCH